jgi:hypothetical protein
MMRAPLRDHGYQLTGLGPAVADFLAWKRLDGAAERTLDQYERDLARACILFPEKTLETLTSEDLLHVVGVFPPRSQKRARAALASMFKWAILWGRIEKNPMDRIPRAPQPPGRYVEVFTDAEVAALTSLDELRDRALMAVLFDAGLRKAEARHLRAGRCLLEGRQLVVVGGKGGKDRVIPMGERLTAALADLFLTEGIEANHFPWYSRRGNQHGWHAISRTKPIGEGTFHRWWERCPTPPACATATRTWRGTRSQPAGFAAAGAWRRFRRRWAMPRLPQRSTFTATSTSPTWRATSRSSRVSQSFQSKVRIYEGRRRGPDSNRCTRLCRPLPNLSATAPRACHRTGRQSRTWQETAYVRRMVARRIL